MKKKDLNSERSKKIEELLKKVSDLRLEITKLKLEKNLGKLKNVHLVRQKRKDLAQILTLISQKKIQGEKNV